jgi:hypothetical protein
VGHRNDLILQAAKDVQASQATLADVFERIESFFRRLEIYTNVPTTDDRNDGYDHSDIDGGTLYPWDRDEGDQGKSNE